MKIAAGHVGGGAGHDRVAGKPLLDAEAFSHHFVDPSTIGEDRTERGARRIDLVDDEIVERDELCKAWAIRPKVSSSESAESTAAAASMSASSVAAGTSTRSPTSLLLIL